MWRLALIVIGMVALPVHASVWTCKEGDRVTFQSFPCEAPAVAVDFVERHDGPITRRVIQTHNEAPKRALDACRSSSDCPHGTSCKVPAGKDRGICYW